LHMVTVTGHFAFFSQNCDMSLKRDVRMWSEENIFQHLLEMWWVKD
jgi:hypothetical protein